MSKRTVLLLTSCCTILVLFLALVPCVRGLLTACGTVREDEDCWVRVCTVDEDMNPLPGWPFRLRCYNDEDCTYPCGDWSDIVYT